MRTALWLFAVLLVPAQVAPPLATITGVVTDSTRQLPITAAVVTARSPRAGLVANAITGEDGRFAIAGLLAGSYLLTASKAGFLEGTYGSSSFGEPGIPLTLSPGRLSVHVEMPLVRGGVVFGDIKDDQSQPERGAEVTLLRVARLGDEDVAQPISTVRSDDRGRFRIYGIAPGQVVVSVKRTARSAGGVPVISDDEIDQLLLWLRQGRRVPQARDGKSALATRTTGQPVPIYFPGGSSIGPSGTLSVEAGSESQLDMFVTEVKGGTVSGTVVGLPVGATASVALEPSHALRIAGPGRTTRTATTSPAGDFRFVGVSPGSYALRTRAAEPAKDGARDSTRPLLASGRVEVAEGQESSIVLSLSPAVEVAGRVILAPSRAGLAAPREIVIQLTSSVTSLPASVLRAQVNQDGRFLFRNVRPGPYHVSVEVGADMRAVWMSESAQCGAVDALDMPCDLPQTDDIVVSITDRQSGITGRLDTGEGFLPSELQIVAFSATETDWRRGSRRLGTARPDADGFFEFDMPSGSYYLGVTTPVPLDGLTSHMLRRLALSAVRVQVPLRQVVNQALRVAR